MQSLSKFNKRIKYLLDAIDLFSKYVWLLPLKDKRGITTVITFEKIISKGRKAKSDPNQLKYGWIKEVDFIEIFLRDFLKISNIEMYSTYNEGKSVFAERFIRTLKEKIFKHMAAVSKNFYFDVLDDIVNKYNNIVHRAIKMKPS